MNYIRHWFLLSVLFLAVLITSWFIMHANENSSDKNQRTTENDFSSFANQVHIISLDKEGRISSELESPRLEHFEKMNTTRLTTPVITIHTKEQPDWKIIAKEGEILHDKEEVLLKNHVVIHQDAGKKNDEITIKTPLVSLFPNQKIANTEAPIELLSTSTHIDAVGMQANLDEGTLELKTQAKGHYRETSY